jgi:hypothetical protein
MGKPLHHHYTVQECLFGENRGADLVTIIIYLLLKGFLQTPLFFINQPMGIWDIHYTRG